MPKNLIESLGTVGYDNLINSNVPVADVFTAKIRGLAAKPTYKRGTVLAFSSGTVGDNKLVILGTEAAENETLTPNCILAEDVTLDSGDTFASHIVQDISIATHCCLLRNIPLLMLMKKPCVMQAFCFLMLLTISQLMRRNKHGI